MNKQSTTVVTEPGPMQSGTDIRTIKQEQLCSLSVIIRNYYLSTVFLFVYHNNPEFLRERQ